jgi:glycosyltransferase involved in cell wall biosynthesis
MTHLSVVIPVHNERSLIDELVKRVKTNVKLITEDFEIIVVDDGSQDDTWSSIENEARLENRIKGIKFSRNFGHHYAITAGLHKATGEWVVVMDGDLQDRPEVIPELYKKALEGFDVVFVSRQNRPEKLYYRIAQKIFYMLLRTLSGLDFDSRQANFSIINKKVVEAFKIFPENARFYGSTIMWLGFKKSFILADHGVRYAGRPSYSLRKRFKLALDVIVSFSARPLRWSIILGFVMSVLSIFFALWIVYKSFYYGFEAIGWASLMASIFFSTGVILIVTGVSAVYLGAIFNQVKNRPIYITDKVLNLNDFEK